MSTLYSVTVYEPQQQETTVLGQTYSDRQAWNDLERRAEAAEEWVGNQEFFESGHDITDNGKHVIWSIREEGGERVIHSIFEVTEESVEPEDE